MKKQNFIAVTLIVLSVILSACGVEPVSDIADAAKDAMATANGPATTAPEKIVSDMATQYATSSAKTAIAQTAVSPTVTPTPACLALGIIEGADSYISGPAVIFAGPHHVFVRDDETYTLNKELYVEFYVTCSNEQASQYVKNKGYQFDSADPIWLNLIERVQ